MWILEWIMKFHVGNSLFHFMRARATTGGRQPDRFTGLTFVKARRPRALSRRNCPGRGSGQEIRAVPEQSKPSYPQVHNNQPVIPAGSRHRHEPHRYSIGSQHVHRITQITPPGHLCDRQVSMCVYIHNSAENTKQYGIFEFRSS